MNDFEQPISAILARTMSAMAVVVALSWVAVAGCRTPDALRPAPAVSLAARAEAVAYLVAQAAPDLGDPTPTPTPDPGDKVVVGDACPQCNDPPGKCGAGKTGDGNICQPCRLCRGDGRVDEGDPAIGTPAPTDAGMVSVSVPVPVVTLHTDRATAPGWPAKWWRAERPGLLVRADVQLIEETAGGAWLEACVGPNCRRWDAYTAAETIAKECETLK